MLKKVNGKMAELLETKAQRQAEEEKEKQEKLSPAAAAELAGFSAVTFPAPTAAVQRLPGVAASPPGLKPPEPQKLNEAGQAGSAEAAARAALACAATLGQPRATEPATGPIPVPPQPHSTPRVFGASAGADPAAFNFAMAKLVRDAEAAAQQRKAREAAAADAGAHRCDGDPARSPTAAVSGRIPSKDLEDLYSLTNLTLDELKLEIGGAQAKSMTEDPLRLVGPAKNASAMLVEADRRSQDGDERCFEGGWVSAELAVGAGLVAASSGASLAAPSASAAAAAAGVVGGKVASWAGLGIGEGNVGAGAGSASAAGKASGKSGDDVLDLLGLGGLVGSGLHVMPSGMLGEGNNTSSGSLAPNSARSPPQSVGGHQSPRKGSDSASLAQSGQPQTPPASTSRDPAASAATNCDTATATRRGPMSGVDHHNQRQKTATTELTAATRGGSPDSPSKSPDSRVVSSPEDQDREDSSPTSALRQQKLPDADATTTAPVGLGTSVDPTRGQLTESLMEV